MREPIGRLNQIIVHGEPHRSDSWAELAWIGDCWYLVSHMKNFGARPPIHPVRDGSEEEIRILTTFFGSLGVWDGPRPVRLTSPVELERELNERAKKVTLVE